MADEAFDSLVASLDTLGTGHLAMVTGAGISLASGIPTFRGDDPGAVWKNDVLEKGTYQYFRRDPVASWQWSCNLFKDTPKARPNPAHRGVAALHRRHVDRGGRATTLTQNVDTLHEQAGSDDVIKVHGSIDRVRCASEMGCPNGAPRGTLPLDDIDLDGFLEAPSLATLPKCPLCGDYLRHHVLWFDEFYAEHEDYQWHRVQDTILTMDLLLFIGTSFSVGVTDAFLNTALMGGVPTYLIDPDPEPPARGIAHIQEKAELALPRLCDALGCALET